MRIAVVGSGIAGLGAAHALARSQDVTVFEAAPRAGGHVHTVDVDGLSVDMGFIVCNRENYPHLFALFAELGIDTRPTTMSFSVALPDLDLEWGSASLGAMFADRRRLADPRHWRMLARVVRFLSRARTDLARGLDTHLSVDDYITLRGLADLRETFLVPLTAALWSLAPDRCGAFPATTFLRFLDQHGMLRAARPLAWRTVVGGSRRYVDALLARRRFELRLSTPVARIDRDAHGVTVTARRTSARFDRVLIATHANTALAMLAAPTADERRVLGAFRYSTNRTVLHRDRRFLPRRPAAHAAWNYVRDPDTSHVAVTYSMSRLQGLPDDPPYLVTLNPRTQPAHTIHEVTFEHPQLDAAALRAQGELAGLGRAHRTYYAGAHVGFGFHEDGLRSGLAAAASAMADEHAGVATEVRPADAREVLA